MTLADIRLDANSFNIFKKIQFPTRMSLSLRVVFACVLTVCAGACSSTETYRLTLKDGREFQAASKPQMQRKTGYYRYKNFEGRDALIRAEEVLLIVRES